MNASLVYYSQWGFLLLGHFPFFYSLTPLQITLLHVHRYHKNFVNKIWVTGS